MKTCPSSRDCRSATPHRLAEHRNIALSPELSLWSGLACIFVFISLAPAEEFNGQVRRIATVRPDHVSLRRLTAVEPVQQTMHQEPVPSAPVAPLPQGEAPLPQPLDMKPIDQINVQIGLSENETPPDLADPQFAAKGTQVHVTGTNRPWAGSVKSWTAPGLWHMPLYFEEINLERHGKGWSCLQPAVSAGHFVGNFVTLPYHLVHTPPHRCQCDLGHERPGNCVPYRAYRDPLDVKAAAAEAATVAGLILLFP